jgi:hypothetical protein
MQARAGLIPFERNQADSHNARPGREFSDKDGCPWMLQLMVFLVKMHVEYLHLQHGLKQEAPDEELHTLFMLLDYWF